MTDIVPSVSVERQRSGVRVWDVVAALLVLALIAALAEASRGAVGSLSELQATPLSLSPWRLPEYALRTAVRMLIAMALSLAFTFTYATWAAKSRRAATLLIPLLDILQSVPILGFMSITVVFFLSLAPGRVLGAEFAAIFAIFTSQAWNMAFSFYQSLRTTPIELVEAAKSLRLSGWMRFWRLDVPFAAPPLVWNMMISMSGGWFFVVASEVISVGDTSVTLPGIGSYIAVAIAARDLGAIGWAIATMLVVILGYDLLLFRPLVAWSERFRLDLQPGEAPKAFALTVVQRSRLGAVLTRAAGALLRRSDGIVRRVSRAPTPPRAGGRSERSVGAVVWVVALAVLVAAALWTLVNFVGEGDDVGWAEAGRVAVLGLATMARVFVLILLASALWTPIGVWVGLRPKVASVVQPVAQFLAAFPANLLFPIVVSAVVAYRLDPDVWLSPLMILGTQWFILFNVVAGAAALPRELRDVGVNLGVGGLLWWRRIGLPCVMPYYVTGAIAASGGSWNASIVAEVAVWGSTRVEATGLGAYIANATAAGDLHRVVLGVAVMSGYVIVISRLVWRPLYWWAERKFRLA